MKPGAIPKGEKGHYTGIILSSNQLEVGILINPLPNLELNSSSWVT